MSRQRLTIGTYGDIWFSTSSTGRCTVRANYRDWEGKNRVVQCSGATRPVAERALKAKLLERSLFNPELTSTPLTPDSSFGELVDYWLEDLDLEGRIAKSTRELDERNMRALVWSSSNARTPHECHRVGALL
ncbi:hypothetical protein [Citricoccus muralis]|uniref:Integrase-like protein n=1 Tax=Citricoccus muralis TaxID=169134 RepID=A0ABY8H7U9_9MICC|nr:hypothetical protein [Citricoccus muralis]WFP17227.1 hypothetical protein P8192_03675 [Citricoccus muralis]